MHIYIYFFFKLFLRMHMDCNTYFSAVRPFLAENDASAW